MLEYDWPSKIALSIKQALERKMQGLSEKIQTIISSIDSCEKFLKYLMAIHATHTHSGRVDNLVVQEFFRFSIVGI